jgi:photosystem II stability/assembly factor-like uncharacterized protein
MNMKAMKLVTPILLIILFSLQSPVLPLPVDDATNDASGYSATWQATGPPGGDVRDLVVDPKDPDRLYFGTLDGQIYTSSDGAKHWSLLYNFNRPKLFVDHILVDPRDSQVLYAATHRHKEPGGFFKSTDGGRNWKESSQLKNEALHSMTQSKSNPNVLIIGTFNGIFRSDDSGDSWEQLPTQATPGLVHVESLAMDPRSSDIIYAGTWYLPYKTVDGGKTWKSIKNGIIDDSDIFAIDIDPQDPNHLIASACSGIYETKNAGESWRKVQGIPSQSRRTRAILQHPSIPGVVFAGTTEGFWRSEKGGDADSWMVTTSRQLEINSITVHPTRPETVFIGTNNYGVMVSNDSGKTFIPTNSGYSGRFANSIVADWEMPNRIYAATINTATGGGFFFTSTDNGQTWRPSMRNMPSRLITYSILQDLRDANIIYLGTNLGVYRSVDRGATWAPIWAGNAAPDAKKPGVKTKKGSRAKSTKTQASGKPNDIVMRAQNALNSAGYKVAVADGRSGTRTTLAIRKFQTDKSLPVTGKLDAITLAALGVASEGAKDGQDASVIITDGIRALVHSIDAATGSPVMLAATNVGIYRTSDPLKGWQRLSIDADFDPTCIATDPQHPEQIWVGTAASGVVVSRDGGQTWQQVKDIPSDVPVNTIVQDPKRLERIYVGTKQAFYASHDGGVTWNRRGGNLPFGDFTSILINSHNTDEVFVGNAFQNGEIGGGVWRTLNAGKTWARIDPKGQRLPSQRIWSLAFDGQDQNVLFVGSHSAGVYVVPRSETASVGSR